MSEAARVQVCEQTGLVIDIVESSLAYAAIYKESNQVLVIFFRNGAATMYKGVSLAVYTQLTNPNNSLGRMYNQLIRGNFEPIEIEKAFNGEAATLLIRC